MEEQRKRSITLQAMWHRIAISGRVERVFISQLGGFVGGGAEKTPAGDYSINTPSVGIESFELCSDDQFVVLP
jgi:hypothetical protein